MKEKIIFVSVLSLIVFCVISLIRLCMILFFTYTIKKYKEFLTKFEKNNIDNAGTYAPSSNREDELLRNKDKETKIEQQESVYVNVQKMPKNVVFEEPSYKKEIVGVVKPIGKWTSLIIGQKVGYMMQEAGKLKEENSAGYWQVMGHATDKSQGKGKGRN